MKSLCLSGNKFDELTSSTFSRLKELQILDLSLTSVGMLPEYVFQDLHALRTLNLSQSVGLTIESFPHSIFKGLSNLQRLDLKLLPSYKINPFTPALFDELINLEYLDLSYCNLYSFPTITNLTSLRYLDISGNYYLDFKQGRRLQLLHSVSTLGISFQACTFNLDLTPSSCMLDFYNENRLQDFVMTLPISLSTLKLMIRGCEPFLPQYWLMDESEPSELFTQIPDTSIKKSRLYFQNASDADEFQDSMRWKSHITYLHIQSKLLFCRTSMVSIADDAFAIFPHLRLLNISSFYDSAYTTILSMSKYSFRGLTDLRTLSLSKNYLTHVPWDSLKVLSRQLKHLDLSSNKIGNTGRWNNSFCSNITRLHLKTLDVSNNPVSILDLTLFGNDTLNKVYLMDISPKYCFNLSTNPALKTLFISARKRAILNVNNICVYSQKFNLFQLSTLHLPFQSLLELRVNV